MKNLQNYGVQELNTRELQTTDGGWAAVGWEGKASLDWSGVGHALCDFGQGLVDGLSSLWS